MASAHMSRIAQGWGAAHSCAYCHGFAKIPPLIRGTDGRMHINPDFEMVKTFSVRAEPFGFTIPAGRTATFTITVPAEGEDLGDLLINEFRAIFTPNTVRNISVEFFSNQTSRIFQNAPVFNTLVFGDSFLNCCLPCCTLVQATQSLTLTVTNNEAVGVGVSITAYGKRFLPKSEELRARMLMYWNSIPSYPYYLTLDQQEVRVNAGRVVTAEMTVPGHGNFEAKWPRTEAVAVPAGGAPDPNDILVTVTQQVGRQQQSDPIQLGALAATPTLAIAGFPGGLYRAAQACHCPPASQLFKGNERLRVRFENTGGVDAIVRYTFAGCFHQVGECPPGRSMDRIRSLEPTIGPLLIPQRDYCPPDRDLPDYQQAETEQWTPSAPAVPPPVPRQPTPTMFAPVAGGAAGVAPGGPLSYMSKYYRPGPGGTAAPKTGAHGYARGRPIPRRGVPGINGLGSQVHLQPGQPYFDPVTQQWRKA